MLDAIALHTVDRSLADAAMQLIQDYGPLRGADAAMSKPRSGVAEF